MVLLFLTVSSLVHAGNWATVKWVVDGDTIVLNNGKHVRYIGINAPETAHENKPAEPLGYQSRELNRTLVLKEKRVQLKFDKEKYDRYGRLLAYVYTEKGAFVNLEMVKRGYAHVLYKKPNTRHNREFLKAQHDAMEKGRGIWGISSMQLRNSTPYLGNKNSKRFHELDCPFGRQTSANNRTRFISRWDSFWSGYSPCKKCILPTAK